MTEHRLDGEVLEKARSAFRGEIATAYDASLAAPSTLDIDPLRRQATITIHERFRSFAPYLTAHECGHVIRAFGEPGELPYLAPERAQLMAARLRGSNPALAREYGDRWNAACRGWLGGLATQLVNHPTDVAIETWIRREQPELHELQKEYWEMALPGLRMDPDRKVRSGTPYQVYRSSRALDKAFCRLMEEALTESQGAPPAAEGVADRLVAAYYQTRSHGSAAQQDAAVCRAWAELLQLSELIAWHGNGTAPQAMPR